MKKLVDFAKSKPVVAVLAVLIILALFYALLPGVISGDKNEALAFGLFDPFGGPIVAVFPCVSTG